MAIRSLCLGFVGGMTLSIGLGSAVSTAWGQDLKPDTVLPDLQPLNVPVPQTLTPNARPNPFNNAPVPEPLDLGTAQGGVDRSSPAAPLPPGLHSQGDQFDQADQFIRDAEPTPSDRFSQDNQRTPITAPISTNQRSSRSDSPFSPRLARAPYVLGDSFAPSMVVKTSMPLLMGPSLGTNSIIAEELCVVLPTAGGATRAKIAESTRALPDDRVFLNYNHFHNAVQTQLDTAAGPFGRADHVDRFTLGFEKTFLSQLCSVDVRMPVVADNDFVGPGFIRGGSEAGNLVVSFKGLLLAESDYSLVCGITCDLPTGGDVTALINSGADAISLEARNQAVHLSPFVGMLFNHSRDTFHQVFLQCDVATNDNELAYYDAASAHSVIDLDEQTLLYFDYAIGKWIYRSRGRSSSPMDIRGIAALMEFHYTTTLEDADIAQITTSGGDFVISSVGNRLDIFNLTLGFQTNLAGGAIVRIGGVVPITQDDDRFFDAEVQAQLILPL